MERMKIISKDILADVSGATIVRIEVRAPHIAPKAMPGQFVVLMVSGKGERIPLTIVDKKDNAITLIFQVAGYTTGLLADMKVGDSLYSVVGPLGHPTEIKKYGKVVLTGGGVGIAEIYPVAKALREKGNHITTILGARTKGLLVLEEELKKFSDVFFVTTDDGSHGRKGFTTDVLNEIMPKGEFDLVYAVGPIAMMRRVAAVTEKFGVRTLVSLNAIMVDASGMCGCCRVAVGGQTKFSCIDGPEFDGHLVDWDELEMRSKIYASQEKHICKLR